MTALLGTGFQLDHHRRRPTLLTRTARSGRILGASTVPLYSTSSLAEMPVYLVVADSEAGGTVVEMGSVKSATDLAAMLSVTVPAQVLGGAIGEPAAAAALIALVGDADTQLPYLVVAAVDQAGEAMAVRIPAHDRGGQWALDLAHEQTMTGPLAHELVPGELTSAMLAAGSIANPQ